MLKAAKAARVTFPPRSEETGLPSFPNYQVSNLTLACVPCNQAKGNQDIRDFLHQNPDVLNHILKQAKSPLKDQRRNSTRWALFNALKRTGLPVATGTGRETKFNRTRFGLPKAH